MPSVDRPIVVTGATGHVGGLVAAALARRGLRQRLLVRDPSRSFVLAAGEFDVRSDDYRQLTGREPPSLAGVIERLHDEML